jgi:hypothetical protein
MEWGPEATGDTAQAIAAVLDGAVEFLRAGQDAGVFQPLDARQAVVSILGMHFMPFAISGVVERFTKLRAFEPACAEVRGEAVRAHVRSLLLAPKR